jgi:hypothetical protein
MAAVSAAAQQPAPPAPASPQHDPLDGPASETAASLGQALLAFHRRVGRIRKESDAKYGRFADLSTVLEAVTPALLEQGLVLTQTIAETSTGGCLLRTELIHAGSDERLVSTCPIPSLQQLLERVHELRGQVLARFPLDLQLAAIGALPPVLPPRPQEAGTELPPPPARQPGLRIEDQLKGLYTLLGQLGTTTNPLHALGGTITYLRRYQILALLSLAPTDDDGEVLASSASSADPTPQPETAAPAVAPATSTGRSRRSSTARPKPTPAPPAPEPEPLVTFQAVQQPAAQAPAAPQSEQLQGSEQPDPAIAAEPAVPPSTDHPLTQAEVQQLVALIRTLPSQKVPQLVGAFRQHFQLPQSVLISDYLRNHSHALFVRRMVEQLSDLPQAA